MSFSLESYHRKHFRKLRSGAREHRGHDEVQERHQFQEVVLQRSSCQQQAMLSLYRGGGSREEKGEEGSERDVKGGAKLESENMNKF